MVFGFWEAEILVGVCWRVNQLEKRYYLVVWMGAYGFERAK